MKFTNAILIIFTFVLSYSNYGQEPSKMKQVISHHDEVMNKMPHLVRLVNKLQPLAKAHKEDARYQSAIDSLKKSNKSMAKWMQGFGERFTADEMIKGKKLNSLKMTLLLEEEEKIKALHRNINSSISQAEKLLKK